MEKKNNGWISPSCICTDFADGTEENTFNRLSILLENSGCVADRNQVLKDIEEREERGSTQLTPSIWIPHAKSSGVIKMCTAIGIIKHSKLCIMVSCPENNSQHLKRIAALMDVLQNEKLVKNICSAENSDQAYSIISSHLCLFGMSC